jgi:hypothetical protein
MPNGLTMAMARLRQAALDVFSAPMGQEYVQVANCQSLVKIRIFCIFPLTGGAYMLKLCA